MFLSVLTHVCTKLRRNCRGCCRRKESIHYNNNPYNTHMKFLYTALLSVALLAFAGCGGSSSAALPSTQNAPKFDSAAANDYVKAFSDYANQAVAAYKAKDAAKIAALSSKAQDMATKASTAIQSLKGADVQKLQDWMTKVSTEMSTAVSNAAK